MDNPVGTIQSIQDACNGRRFTVAVDVSVACPRCAAGKGCGAGVFSARQQMQTVDATADEPQSLAVGDSVELQLAETRLLNAAFIVYGIPLAGALGATALAYVLRLGDAAAALAAVIGLTVGLLVGRWRLARPNCLHQFVPRVEKRI